MLHTKLSAPTDLTGDVLLFKVRYGRTTLEIKVLEKRHVARKGCG